MPETPPAAIDTLRTLVEERQRKSLPIDRHAVVTRHHVVLTAPDAKLPLQVGNGEFAFTVDATGLQTFLPANTMSQWGWHTSPLPAGKQIEDFKMTEHEVYGRTVGYATEDTGQKELFAWLRENPHRLNLGKISMRMTAGDGQAATVNDLKQVSQELDLWRGLIVSRFEFDGQAVRVETCCHPSVDAVAVKIDSSLITNGKLSVVFEFPYGSPGLTGADWSKPSAHHTVVAAVEANRVVLERKCDSDSYAVGLAWSGKAVLAEEKAHTFILEPAAAEGALEFVCTFASAISGPTPSVFADVKRASADSWEKFWKSGGAVDLSQSKDPRWKELERRIVLSQYLEAVNGAGSLPPQESGLVNNGWNGKFHLEMHWWHGVHFALWDRWPMFDRSLGWYRTVLPAGRKLAQSQGYRGVRWPKMVGPEGRDSPSRCGPLLIWQQPNPIYYAHLDYSLHPTRETLEKWKDVVLESAAFMASYAVFDKQAGCYVLGPPMKTVPENTIANMTKNPAFELSYWRFGLRVGQQWRVELGLKREPEWDRVLNGLAKIPQANGLYLQQEGMLDTYEKMNWEHPSLIGLLGMLPGDGVDPVVMKATVRKVMTTWEWDKCWGWDFPMMAMAAARNGEPGMALDALMNPSPRNRFSANGFSSGGPYPYFPSNGGLLAAVAMMCAGWDSPPAGSFGGASACPDRNAPGFPDDGSWVVKWEGLNRMP
jgi:hypothetical protein